jgi:exopolysaccharide biosynthesis polyprenyl glycosylphosphotransferase
VSRGWSIGVDRPGGRLAGPRGRLGGRDARQRTAVIQAPDLTGPVAGARRDSLFRRMLLSADICSLLLALLLTTSLARPSLSLGWGSLLGLLLVMGWAKLSGLYDRDEALIHKTTLDEAPKLLQLSTLCTLAVWIADRPILDGSLRRGGALLLWGSLSTLLVASRTAVRSLALRLTPTERCLFIGDVVSERRVQSKLAENCGTNATIVAHLEREEAARWCSDAFTPTRLADIRELTHRLDVHRVIVAPDSADGGDMLELVCALKAVGVRVSVLPRLLEVVGSSVEFDDLHGLTIMGVRRFALTRSTAAVKRAFDLLAASVVLLASLPLMVAIAVAIKLDSPGPVFFRQLRVGRHGTRFQMFKFRTMVRGAETMREALADRNEAREGLFKIVDDPRVTRVGALLRKSCLDELPQLLNILRGEMSLVGPRPLVVEEDSRVEGRHRRRLELLPGITGHWQIMGPARVPLREMAAIDYLYVANWSLWTDMKILLRTVPHVIARRGM